MNRAFASLCNTFSSDTVAKAAAVVAARNINSRFLCCVYVSNQGPMRVALDGPQIGPVIGQRAGLTLLRACGCSLHARLLGWMDAVT